MSRNLNSLLPSSRILIEMISPASGPVLVVFAGVHGNEPSGWQAIKKVKSKIEELQIEFRGSFYGIVANLPAAQASERYIDEDLNRLFLEDRVEKVLTEGEELNSEERELSEILKLTDRIREQSTGEIFFIDCHTTSSESIPYISMNEGYHESYVFAKGIAATSIMGIEREIKGCLPEWFNRQGWHGFTFEAGQHFAQSSVESQEAIIWQGLAHAGCISENQYAELLESSHNVLYAHGAYHDVFYTVVSSYHIQPDEEFIMKPGFVNLQKIHRGELLATSNGQPVYSPANAHILMPLYQKQGNHGFFIAEEVDERYLEFKES